MPLLPVVATLIAVGVRLWLVKTSIPMDGLWLLLGFGVLSRSGGIRLPH
jgi:hypothetical protein